MNVNLKVTLVLRSLRMWISIFLRLLYTRSRERSFLCSYPLSHSYNPSTLYSSIHVKGCIAIPSSRYRNKETSFLFFSPSPHHESLHMLHRHSVQFSSVAQSCPTLCDPMNRSMPGLPVHHHQLPEFTQTHAHRVSDAIQQSHPLSSPPSSLFVIL